MSGNDASTMRVRIVECSNALYWYRNQIGSEHTVYGHLVIGIADRPAVSVVNTPYTISLADCILVAAPCVKCAEFESKLSNLNALCNKADAERDAALARLKEIEAPAHRTLCGGCGKIKLCLLRCDSMGGDVCLTCVNHELSRLRLKLDEARKAADGMQRTAVARHDWYCACGHWNGCNLSHCACCNRTPAESWTP